MHATPYHMTSGTYLPAASCVFLTGASGLVGHALLLRLLEEGWTVHALVRDVARARLPASPRLKVFVGDINEPETIAPAMAGCQGVFHLAALVEPLAGDRALLYSTNVEGTRHILEAALQAGVQRVVFTSTCGVAGPSMARPLREQDPRIAPFMLDYDASKQLAEEVVAEYRQRGLDVVIVSLAKVFGEGEDHHALAFNHLIRDFLRRRFVLLPKPETLSMSVAFLDDVVQGHMLAMTKGRHNEKYFLSGHDVTQAQFFRQLALAAGVKVRVWLLPQPLMRMAGLLHALWQTLLHHAPFRPRAVEYLFHHYCYNTAHAWRELGYTLTPLHDAISRTVRYLQGRSPAPPVISPPRQSSQYAAAS